MYHVMYSKDFFKITSSSILIFAPSVIATMFIIPRTAVYFQIYFCQPRALECNFLYGVSWVLIIWHSWNEVWENYSTAATGSLKGRVVCLPTKIMKNQVFESSLSCSVLFLEVNSSYFSTSQYTLEVTVKRSFCTKRRKLLGRPTVQMLLF